MTPEDETRPLAPVTSLDQVRRARERAQRESRIENFIRSLSREELENRLIELAENDWEVRERLGLDVVIAERTVEATVAFVRSVAATPWDDRESEDDTELEDAMNRLSMEMPDGAFLDLAREVLVTGARSGDLFVDVSNVMELALGSMQALEWDAVRCMTWFCDVELEIGWETNWFALDGIDPTDEEWRAFAKDRLERFARSVPGPGDLLAIQAADATWLSGRMKQTFEFLLRTCPVTGHWEQAATFLERRHGAPYRRAFVFRFLEALSHAPGDHSEVAKRFHALAITRRRTKSG